MARIGVAFGDLLEFVCIKIYGKNMPIFAAKGAEGYAVVGSAEVGFAAAGGNVSHWTHFVAVGAHSKNSVTVGAARFGKKYGLRQCPSRRGQR